MDAFTEPSKNLSVRAGFKVYCICLAAFLAALFISISIGSQLLFYPVLAIYIYCGIHLNRNVLRRLIEWHPMHNTLNNVASAKFKQAALWPISYLALFVQLGINKVL
jgi:polyferredoxin